MNTMTMTTTSVHALARRREVRFCAAAGLRPFGTTDQGTTLPVAGPIGMTDAPDAPPGSPPSSWTHQV